MADRIHGPLNTELTGHSGPVMAFVHPNPMDQSCWMYQTTHFSTWFRCVGIDIPGYGRSPKADPGLTMDDMATACWEAIDAAYPGEDAILFGCSTGASIVPHMHNLKPERTKAIVVCGTGYNPKKEFAPRRINAYKEYGIDFRWDYTFQDLSANFRATPMAHYFANLFAERNVYADVDTIIYQFEALMQPYPEGHHAKITAPMIILSGSEDNAHQSAFELQRQVKGCEMRVLHGAGHACQLEQPWLFDKYVVEFLTKHGLFPDGPKPRSPAF